jgi:hypothetical protein
MNQFGLGCRRHGARRRGLTRLRQLLAEGAFDAVQRARQPIGDIIRQTLAHQDKTPGADRIDRGGLVRIAAGWNRQRLEEGMLGPDARDLAGFGLMTRSRKMRSNTSTETIGRLRILEAGDCDAATPAIF